MKKIAILFSILALGYSATFAQNANKRGTGDYVLLAGKASDFNTGRILKHASVSLLKSTVSNVTNDEGIFSIKIPMERYTRKDSLEVDYLGYSSLKICVLDFSQNRVKALRLKPIAVGLEAIYIHPNDPATLFHVVFSNEFIKKNYQTEPIGVLGFYRELIKRGNRYASMTEAVVDIHKASYISDFSFDNAAIYKGRGSRNVNISDTIVMKLQGGPLSSLYTDFMKYPFIGTDLLSADYYYDFEFGVPFNDNGRNIYVLDFKQKDSVTDVLYNGELLIDSKTLAVVRATFNRNVDLREDSWKYFIVKKPANSTLKIDNADYTVSYKAAGNGRLCLEYARIELNFSAKYQKRWLKSKYSIVSELAITDFNNPAARKIPTDRRIKMKDIVADKVADFTDPDYWGNYNIIQPDASIESILNKIVRQLKHR